MNLGNLQNVFDLLDGKPTLQIIVKRMAEIDADVSAGNYGGPQDGSLDRSPTGDDYNALWDAVFDELWAVARRAR